MRRLAIVFALAATSCFSPDQPVCAYACGDNGACPDNYECRSDSFCHKIGTTEACPFPDASAPPDLAGADLAGLDMSIPIDMAVPDMSMGDMSVPTDMAKHQDMTELQDGSLTDGSPSD
jgi:hypothetical protein